METVGTERASLRLDKKGGIYLNEIVSPPARVTHPSGLRALISYCVAQGFPRLDRLRT